MKISVTILFIKYLIAMWKDLMDNIFKLFS